MALKLLNEYLNYVDKVFCATLANAVGQERLKVSPVGPLRPAFAGPGIDEVELDAPEVPLRDGSSQHFNLERLGRDLGCRVSPAGLVILHTQKARGTFLRSRLTRSLRIRGGH